MNKKIKSNGIGLVGFIFLLFLGLKLSGVGQVATWSWWWVTSPLWIGTAFYISMFLFFFLVGIVVLLASGIISKLKSNTFGYLIIDSKLAIKILIDGKVIKSLPKKVKLSPGAHFVILVDKDGNKFEKSVLIIADQSTTISY